MAGLRGGFASITTKCWLKLHGFLWQFPKRLSGPFKRAALHRRTGLRINLGCGDRGCPGFVNVDRRHTSATDVTMDLSRPRFTPGSVRVCFSHAFLEHLLRNDRLPHLRAIHEALEPGGVVCYLGIPDFANIARFYLGRRPGIVGPVFDLFNVYRYTHGDPESVGWYMAQLHKSLFDYGEVVGLLTAAGFRHFVVVSYCFGTEKLPVNLGFFAVMGELEQGRDIYRECLTFMGEHAGQVNLGSASFFRGAGAC
jgi:predicted SAM-dependent methyltransferase